jgi:hypothetical protein
MLFALGYRFGSGSHVAHLGSSVNMDHILTDAKKPVNK